MATDELILARTLGLTFSRDGRGHVEQPERLYKPYVVRAGGAQVACAFRDHVLSDLIGFTYSGWAAEAAAEDFVLRLVEAGAPLPRADRRGRGADPHHPRRRECLGAFRGRRPAVPAGALQASVRPPRARTVTMAEACAGADQELPGIFPGSWIDANFYIWIGHRDDQKAWSQLADARDALDDAVRHGVDSGAVAEAREELLIAEGSDWFWWYGDDHSSAHDAEFDDLFRRHVRNVYRRLQVPDSRRALRQQHLGRPRRPRSRPSRRRCSRRRWTAKRPATSSGWAPGRSRSGRSPARCTRPTAARRSISLAHFGFDHQRLFVRVDAASRVLDLLADGRELSLKFASPKASGSRCVSGSAASAGSFWDRQRSGTLLARAWSRRGDGGRRHGARAGGAVHRPRVERRPAGRVLRGRLRRHRAPSSSAIRRIGRSS